MIAELTRPCPDCFNGFRWESRRGGLDPDGREIECDNCDGSAAVTVMCEACITDHPATEWVCGVAVCDRVAAELRDEAGLLGESV